MVKRSRAEFLASNLPQLQNLIKRDPTSYHDEFLQQWRHFESELTIFKLKPDTEATQFGELITFISHVSQCYTQDCAEFPQQIIELLSTHYQILEPNLRKTMVQALVLLRNKDLISATSLLSLFFTLFRVRDKQLRSMLHNHIVNDIKNANAKSKNNKLNKTMQNFMYTMLKDSNEIAAKKSLEVMIDLYRKNVWNDAKTVNVIGEACFSPASKIVAPALHFFLGENEKKEEDEESDADVPDLNSLKHSLTIGKTKKSKKNALGKALATVKRKERQRNRGEIFNFSALHLLNDPQGFAEKLFSRLRQSTSNNSFRFELRMQMMNLVSRLIGIHKLILFNFYEYVITYLKPQQRDVTQILAYTAQASHDLVPPDALTTVVEAIANNFIWNNVASEVVTAGLNGIREICVRCPLAMPETLLQSMIEDYKNSREKGPMNAARALLGLYREINPEMLRKKDRGKAAIVQQKNFVATQYGEVRTVDGIEGLDILDRAAQSVADKAAGIEEEPSGDENEGGEDDEEDLEELSDEEELDLDNLEEWEEASLDSEDEEDLEGEEEGDSGEGEKEEDAEESSIISPAKKVKINSGIDKILTDDDFRKLRKIRQLQAAQQLAGLKPSEVADELADLKSDDEDDADKGVVDVSQIMKGIRRKDDYETRIASIKADERSSITNREKSKKTKAYMMIVHKRSVVGKAKRSLRDKQKVLRQHVKKQKMKKH
ncbi:SDA1-domain-containing protein [Phlyctochytrium arcticum]|nr:SDA1-domain-containing protein [Phlyctochytrium arcticum]